MAPVADEPFLSYLLRQLENAGFARIVLCLGYGHECIERWIRSEPRREVEIEFSVEDEPLGTAGAVRLAAQRYPVHESLFVLNGDSMLQIDFSEMMAFHLQHGALATAGLAWVPDTGRYGAVELDDSAHIVAFREKANSHAAGYINGGVYIFEPAVVQAIPQQGAVSLERTVLPGLCPADLVGFTTEGYFLDIGVPEDFQRAQSEFKKLEWL